MLCSLRVSFKSTLKNLLNCISVSAGTVMFVRGGPEALVHCFGVVEVSADVVCSLDDDGSN